jgi:hypothetical protein
MNLYQITRTCVLITLTFLIGYSIISDIKAGRHIENRVVIAMVAALVAIYKFAG